VPSLTVTHRVIEAVQALVREVAVVVEPGVVGDALAEPHHRVEDLRQLVLGVLAQVQRADYASVASR
jgi:hypothetical protein